MAARKRGGFNLSKLDTIAACNKPVEVEIRDTAGEPTGIFVSILGRDSDVVRGRMRAFAEEETHADASGNGLSDIDRADRRVIATLVAATTGWRDGDERVLEWGDERLEFNADNAAKVYAGILPIREQVSTALFDLSRFMKG